MTKQRISFGGALLASLTAGPIFLVWLGITTLVADPAVHPLDAATAGGLLMIFFPAVICGAIVSLLPNLLGTAFLHAIGRANPGTRLPVFWALAGAALVGLPIALCGSIGGDSIFLTLPLTLTGASCAAICRASIGWFDDQPAGRLRDASTTPHAISACPAK